MTIDIESLSYHELLELKHIIAERLRYLNSINSQQNYKQFKQGDTVSFAHQSMGIQTGTLLEIDEKSATIITSAGQKWRVSSHLLRKVIEAKTPKLSVIKKKTKN